MASPLDFFLSPSTQRMTSRRLLNRLLLLVALAALPLSARGVGDFHIVLNEGAALQANPEAAAAFRRAAAEWESQISDPITVTINADMGTFADPRTIGESYSTTLWGTYDEIRNQLVADSVGKPGKAIISSLPTSATFSADLPSGVSLDGWMYATKANLKAMGFTGLDIPDFGGATDGAITFNQAFAFDYNRSDGITPGTMDFQTVACHEIGHTLGFLSSVDALDGWDGVGQATLSVTPLDLYRFAANQVPTTAEQFAAAQRTLKPGVESVLSDSVNSYAMSTGVIQGDGNQASHWKDDALTGDFIGVMDPTLDYGVIESPSSADFQALNLIGYDIVPEPGFAGQFLALGAVFFAVFQRKRAV